MTHLQLPPLSIYAHMPWCVRKCPYCDFNSHVAPDSIPEEKYVDWLLADLDFDLEAAAGREIQSIFFGGGTPSLFAPRSIERFLTGVRSRLPVADDMEVTMEANPGTIEHGRFEGYRSAGVTRVSLGVQSFDNHQLKVLGRIHDADQVVEAVEELKRSGFQNFNLDLMYGLPAQTLPDALADVERALSLGPSHLSHYQLALEPGTVFYHQPPALPDDEVIWEMQVTCQARLAAAGFSQYEVSAYAPLDLRCRHNLNYWQFGDYLGLGAGAHGKWTDLEAQTIHRRERCRQPREYLSREISAARIAADSQIAAKDMAFEFMLNSLRLRDGFSRALFESRSGLELSAIEPTLNDAQQRGLLEEVDPGAWRPTEFGRRFLNDLQAMFLNL